MSFAAERTRRPGIICCAVARVVPFCLVLCLFVVRGADSIERMADGKEWTARNVNVVTAGSYCYDNSDTNCARYGRLYNWDAARRACSSVGNGWRLPTNEEWRRLAKQYGGLLEDSAEAGRAAFRALMTGGESGFGALLGGGRSVDGQYARLDAHGFYWTASESGAETAWLYNFGKGAMALNRHSDGRKEMALSVRCIRD